VSATETPNTETTAAAVEAPPPVERRCPRCGAPLREDQEWCLQCGTGVGALVAPPRGWRAPVAAVGALLALALVAVVLAIVELANDAEQVTTTQPTPAPTAVPTAAPTASATPTPVPTTAGGSSPIADWPAGKTGFTIVLESDSTRSAAEARARELAGQGISVGVLDSTGYKPFTPNRFVVFSGQYPSRADARKAVGSIKSRVAGAQVKRIAPA
jgi:septal ring-binding cell division protein DamX